MDTIYKIARRDFDDRDICALYTRSKEQATYLQSIFSLDDSAWETTIVTVVKLVDPSDKVFFPFFILLNEDGSADTISPCSERLAVGSDACLKSEEYGKLYGGFGEFVIVASSTKEALEKARAWYAELLKGGDANGRA